MKPAQIKVEFTQATEAYRYPKRKRKATNLPPFTMMETGESVMSFYEGGKLYTWNGSEYAPEEGANDERERTKDTI